MDELGMTRWSSVGLVNQEFEITTDLIRTPLINYNYIY